ncbi:MAG: hypothetical protein DMG87_13670, partial [Acidobacteria bacterium]
METAETQPQETHEAQLALPNAGIKSRLREIAGLVRHWSSRHTGEIVWAFVFAVLAGYAFALYIEEPKPYRVYVVADPDTNWETLSNNFRSKEGNQGFANIGDVKVEVQVQMLENNDNESARKKADELAGRPDALLVIQHGRSQHVETSLSTYLRARPQVPLIATSATDDDLLKQCDKSCVDEGWFDSVQQGAMPFTPVLQLSPTNEIQARSAVQFASQRSKRRFLIVPSNDPKDQIYNDNLVKAYSNAIGEAHGEVVGVRKMDALPSESDLETLKPDCVLYAGGVGEAQTLFDHLSRLKVTGAGLMLILSDSVIESRGTDSDLNAFDSTVPGTSASPLVPHPPVVMAATRDLLVTGGATVTRTKKKGVRVNFTYQTDAADYNFHTSGYAEDAFSIALQLISDLNERGGDLRFRLKSFLHIHNVKD